MGPARSVRFGYLGALPEFGLHFELENPRIASTVEANHIALLSTPVTHAAQADDGTVVIAEAACMPPALSGGLHLGGFIPPAHASDIWQGGTVADVINVLASYCLFEGPCTVNVRR